MRKYVKESYVTDFIDEEVFQDIMSSNPEFGEFSSYQQMDGMIVKTIRNKVSGVFPGADSNTTNRYFKFVKTDSGWEAYEVTEYGKKIGDPFSIV